MDDSFDNLQGGQGRVALADNPGWVVPVDMTDILKYDRMVEDVAMINSLNGPHYMREFNKAFDLASSYHSKAVFEYEQAKDASAKAKAVAVLEKAPDWLKDRELRVTEENCKKYADMDTEYLQCRQIEAYWRALVTYLETKVSRFKAAHDDAKKIYDQTRNPLGSSSAVPSGRDSQ